MSPLAGWLLSLAVLLLVVAAIFVRDERRAIKLGIAGIVTLLAVNLISLLVQR